MNAAKGRRTHDTWQLNPKNSTTARKAHGLATDNEHIEEPRSKLQEIFDRKERCHFMIRSLTPQQATGNALAIAVQDRKGITRLGLGFFIHQRPEI